MVKLKPSLESPAPSDPNRLSVWFNQNRHELPAMSEAAVRHAASYTWEKYSEVVIDAIRKLA